MKIGPYKGRSTTLGQYRFYEPQGWKGVFLQIKRIIQRRCRVCGGAEISGHAIGCPNLEKESE